MGKDYKNYKDFISIKSLNNNTSFLFGVIFSLLLLYLVTFLSSPEKNFEELALGQETKSVSGEFEDLKIHCYDLTDYQECLSDYYKFGGNKPVILWLGNSQLHSINDYSEGQKIASSILFSLAKEKNYYLLTLSQPNANLQEHFIILSHLIKKLPIKYLILPVVFDDLREDNIRDALQDIFLDDDSLKFINKSEIGKNLIKNNIKSDNSGNDMDKSKNSLQEGFETLLNQNLEKIWSLWLKRSDLRGDLFNNLYKLRNYVFNIGPTTTRKILPGRYKKNLAALNSLLMISSGNDIKTFMYVVPIRNDIKIPYNIFEYDKFKKDIKKIAVTNDVEFKNLENLIPNTMWGNKQSTTLGKENEVDFMHFKFDGHKILANSIFSEITIIWDLDG